VKLEKLFSPIRIGSMELRNRIVMSPMTTDYASDEGLPTPRLLDYLEARARGGVGLITLEACTIDRRHREVIHSMHFDDDSVIEPHRDLTSRLHALGARVQPQLVHPGPDSMSPFLDGTPSVGPSVIPSYLTGHPSRELAAEEIAEIAARFGEAARRVREAGYDGLELHAAHGYMLIGSFLSPLRNRRSDQYGARKLEDRLRFPLEVLRAIRASAGEGFPVTLRISGYERVPGGRAIDDTQRMAPILARAGVDAFHVSGGVIDRYVTQIVTGSHFGDAHNAAAAAAVKQVVDVPVMVVGRVHTPALAEKLLRQGRADLIAMGRPLLADPELPNAAKSGRLGRIRPCISCENCIDSMEKLDMSCAVNARSGHEGALTVERAAVPRHVVVVGGGPAGLEAARVAALRGHRVTLFERQRVLGGALRLAATVHAENEPFLRYLVGAVRGLPVEIRLGREATPGQLRALQPDVVIVATGGRVVAPEIPGSERPGVFTGPGLRALLEGEPTAGAERGLSQWQRFALRGLAPVLARVAAPAALRALTKLWMPLGRRVAVAGSDLAAVELAEFLASRSRLVALLAAEDRIAPEVGAKRRGEHMDRLDRLGVSVNSGLDYREITGRGIVVQAGDSPPRLVEADSVVMAGEVEPDKALFDAVEGSVPEVYAVGDCTGLGLIRKATAEAVRVACSI
jgi:2,4-dienoyl-CoA reductase (NADPH2)